MNFRLFWRKRVDDQLHTAAFLMRERGRTTRPLRTALLRIVTRLQSDPSSVGESRGDGERVLIEMPLTVWYEVFNDSKVVIIYDAVLYPRRRL
jgi:hypothetical protein